jgi:hypothetical protein
MKRIRVPPNSVGALTLDATRGSACVWVAEVAEFCSSVPDYAGCKSFKVNDPNTWLKAGSQEVTDSIPVSSTNKLTQKTYGFRLNPKKPNRQHIGSKGLWEFCLYVLQSFSKSPTGSGAVNQRMRDPLVAEEPKHKPIIVPDSSCAEGRGSAGGS